MKILISGNLRRYTAYEEDIEVEASSVSSAIKRLTERFPDLRNILYDAEGKLRSVHRVHLNSEVLAPEHLDNPTKPSDEIGILTAIAGG
jgi:molybdopterin converting factor small subunit